MPSSKKQQGRKDQSQQKELSIFETTAQLLEPAHVIKNLPDDKLPIVEAVKELLTGLGSGNTELVEESLMRLGAKQESDLFQKVGHMARTLHNSLTEFKNSLDRDQVTLTTTCIPDAADKLEAVIKMTFDAAHKTLSMTEGQAELISKGQAEIEEMKKKLARSSDPEVRKLMESYLENEQNRLKELERMNSEVLMAQAFQDLTGQALRKVIKLVTELETNLVSLIQVFGGDSSSTPQKEEEKESLQQNGVDSILSSFGF